MLWQVKWLGKSFKDMSEFWDKDMKEKNTEVYMQQLQNTSMGLSALHVLL